jgi:hypothetical protein
MAWSLLVAVSERIIPRCNVPREDSNTQVQVYSKQASLGSLPDAQPNPIYVACWLGPTLFRRPPTTTCLEHCTASNSLAGNPPLTRQNTGDQVQLRVAVCLETPGPTHSPTSEHAG